MLDTHVVQQLSPLGTARGGEDLASAARAMLILLPIFTGPRGWESAPCRPSRCASQIVQGVPSRSQAVGTPRRRRPPAAPGGGVTAASRASLHLTNNAPAAISGHAADVIRRSVLRYPARAVTAPGEESMPNCCR